MKQKYPDELIRQCCAAYKSRTTVTALSNQFNVPRSTIYLWLKHDQKEQAQRKAEPYFKNYPALLRKIHHLETIIEILQSIDCNANSPLDVKLFTLEKLYGKYNVHVMCEALQVSRGTFYNHILRNKRDNTWYAKRKEALRLKIQQVYDDSR